MPLQLREIGFHVQNHATQWHGFQHEIQFQEIVVAWIQLTPSNTTSKQQSTVLTEKTKEKSCMLWLLPLVWLARQQTAVACLE